MTFDLLAIGFFLIASATDADNAAPRLCEPWNMEYTGEDATGAHVIGLWQFNTGVENRDSSPNGRDLDLNGATISPDGRFGSCLESYRGYPVEDVRHAAIVPDDPGLSPDGAFSIEMWIKPKPDLEDYPESFLIDKKYVSHDDYQIVLTGTEKSGLRRLRASLGFGNGSETYHSEQGVFEAGVWYHIAFVYDGAGKGEFFRDGSYFGGAEHPDRESVSSGKHLLSIGDRIGSNYHGFPGYIDQVRICKGALEFRRASFEHISDRTVFVRMEEAPTVELAVTNFQQAAISGAVLRISLDGSGGKEFDLPEIAGGAKHIVQYSLDTGLRHGEYRLKGRLEIPGDKPYSTELSFPVQIVPRPLPYRMPVLMWGIYSDVMKEMERLKHIGFTHVLGLGADYGKIWEAAEPTESENPDGIAENKKMLNAALANGISICAELTPGRWLAEISGKKEFLRIDRKGEINEEYPNICALFPQMKPFCYNVGVSVAKTFGHFPAFDSALLHTEVRDGARLCFHKHDRAAFKEYSGFDIPDELSSKHGNKYQGMENFPESRVVPDDHPLYIYHRWFWKYGDGWNGLNTALNDGLKSTGKKLWTFHDPAVRVASVYGSGGAVDVLSHWTYSYPDPVRIGTATDELLAMAAGAENPQQVMKMTQIIWYRSNSAPMSEESEKKVAAQSAWEDTDPDAAFITIHPMQLREAFWTKIARPIKGIMYHGWQSLVDVGFAETYRYTHPQTQHELARLTREVVKPIGPTLVQVPGVKSDVAFLESFASWVFASRGTYGSGGGWMGDAYIMAQYAQLQPEIIYDETIVNRGLDGFRVLVMMDCDVLTQTVADKVKEFQSNGGIVVGDDRLCPAIKPDILVESYSRGRDASESRAELQKRAVKLREDLEKHYTSYVESSNTDVITYRRRYGSADYVFAINDLREFGDYVGHHKLVMENGLPSNTNLTIQRAGGFVYDLVHSREMDPAQADGKMHIETHLEPCGGMLFMITDRAIDKVAVDLPSMAASGESVTCKVSVTDKAGKPIDAVVPVKVDILDPDGRPAEFSGFYGAADGVLEINLDIASNDVKGIWEVRVKELASGKTAIRYLRVK